MRQVPNNTKNPDVFLFDDPVGIDRVIQTLQVSLQSLDWLEKSFGRAYLQSRKNDVQNSRISDDNIFFPAVFQGTQSGLVRDMEDMLVNDNLDSYSFFYVDSPETVVDEDYEDQVENYFEREISLIVWYNLDRINVRTGIEKLYPFHEELNQEVKELIASTVFLPNERVIITRVEDNPKEIFREFTIDIVEAQNLTFPCGGFRYYLNAKYKGGCP